MFDWCNNISKFNSVVQPVKAVSFQNNFVYVCVRIDEENRSNWKRTQFNRYANSSTSLFSFPEWLPFLFLCLFDNVVIISHHFGILCAKHFILCATMNNHWTRAVIWHKFLVTRSEAVLKSRDLERDYWQSHTKWLFSCLISPIYFCWFEKFDSHYNWTFSPSKMKPIIPFSNLISNIYFRPSSDNFVVVGIIKTKNFKSSACMC